MSLDIQHLQQSRFAIVAVDTDEEGNEDVYSAEGKVVHNATDNTLSIYRTDNGEEELIFVLTEEEFDEIQQADDEQKKELEAEYFIVVDIED